MIGKIIFPINFDVLIKIIYTQPNNMNKLLKISFVILVFTLLANKGFSQTSIAYYNSTDSKIGLAHNFSEKLWAEARVYTTFEDFDSEVVLCYNAYKKENYNFYLGLGVDLVEWFEYDPDILIPIGVQFAPFEKFKNLSFHVEFQAVIKDHDSILQSSLGLRYTFGKK
jgi:hypothetical protein